MGKLTDTKSIILEDNWLEFLSYLKFYLLQITNDGYSGKILHSPTEVGFWRWYMEYKLEESK